MRSTFCKVKLKDILSVRRGTSLSGQYYSTKGNKIRLTLGNFNYPSGGFKDNTSKDNIFFIGPVKEEYILHKGDIITPLTEQVAGLLGETAKIPADNIYIQSGDIGLIIPKENKLYKGFAYYLISSKPIKYQLGAAAQQTKIRHTSPEKIENCIAWVPNDLNVQKNISDFLDALNNKIMLNNKINQELEQMAKTLYDYWFVQFDFPDEKGRPYKSANGKMIYNEVLKREIPEGWEVGTFSSYIHQDKGGDWGKDTCSGNYTKKVSCIRGADFPSLLGHSSSNAPIRYILNKNSSKVLSYGDLIIEISGGSPTQSTGRIGYINQHALDKFDTDIITSNFCKAISLNNDKALYNFYLEWERLYKADVFFNYEGKTTGIKNLLFDTFVESYKIAIPPKNVISSFYDNVSNIFEKIQFNSKENSWLQTVRDFLLPLLMNGQITVSSEY